MQDQGPLEGINKAEGAGINTPHARKSSPKIPNQKIQQNNTHNSKRNYDEAYETAYRIGLAAALISKAQTPEEVQKYLRYIQNAMPEEIWFWTSKLLSEEVGEKALDALAILSGVVNPQSH